MTQSAKAVVVRALGAASVEEIRIEPPRYGEVSIRMAACGVCHSDLSALNGTIAYPLPLVLGHEGAGIVTAVGDGVRDFAAGDHVITSFVNMCGHCSYCHSGRPQLCVRSLQALYTLPDGTVRTRDAHGGALNVFCGCGVMAQHATLHADSLIKVPADVPLDRAALIACGVLTGVGAVTNTARLTAGSVAVVFGCGGVGLNAIQGCALAGARMIVAVDREVPQLELARAFGATHTVNARTEEQLPRTLYKLTEGGADYAFDCVGLGKVTEAAWNVLRRGGTAVAVGIAAANDTVVLNAQRLALGEKTLTGSYFGSARPQEDVPRLLGLYRAGRLKLDELITRRYPIEEAPQALADLAQGGAGRGVILFA
ncbi:MAG TPA: Zn-dependent alcohol dehydrogenase [Steroidobacteraceae bacterium]|jgi:S-(hydroxymethyl)glutathione dehydrogenase/alcohol dehydrogenase|nr:Zn-dependent alcohol dehydrogenase [Steroidobacteraceae bacterium]